MKAFRKMFIVSLVSCVVTTPLYAENDAINRMVNSYDNIVDFEKTVLTANKKAHVPVEVPAFIPKPTGVKKYFASLDANSHQYGFEYMINVDSTSNCHGAKYCNVAILSAQKTDKVDMMKDKNNKAITKAVMMADGTNAYYTPGHAMGDFFPASIQWVDNKVLYKITWNAGKESASDMQDYLVTMANSAKHPGSG